MTEKERRNQKKKQRSGRVQNAGHSARQGAIPDGVQEFINVKAAAELSGLSPSTLRAWERRYGILNPRRSESGRRGYTLGEIERLRALHGLVERGHSIGNIARLPEEQLQKLGQLGDSDRTLEGAAPVPSSSGVPNLEIARSIESLLAALEDFDLDRLSQELLRARTSLNTRTFVIDVIAALMREVGWRVDRSELSIAQEHAFSAILRDHLGQVLHSLNPSARAPVQVAVSTPEGDMHEFGILMSGILCGTHGIRVHYLGANMPAQALAGAVNALRAPILLLGTSPLPEGEMPISLAEYLDILNEKLPQETELWVGGYFQPELRKFTRRRVRHFGSLPDLDAQLVKLSSWGKSQ